MLHNLLKTPGRNNGRAKVSTPEQFAAAATQAYRDALQFVIAVAEREPKESELRTLLQRKKELLIRQLLPVGRVYENRFSPAEQLKARHLTVTSIKTAADRGLWNRYLSAIAGRRSLGRELSEMNTIARYAFFDVLRQRDPAEARRLGIEQAPRSINLFSVGYQAFAEINPPRAYCCTGSSR